MKNWIRVGLPIGVGLAAGVMNWLAVQSKLQPVAFVAVNRAVPRGEAIHAGDLVKVAVAGDTRQLLRGALSWEERSTAYGALASRELHSGDLLLLADTRPSSQVKPIEGERVFSLSTPNETPLSHVFADQWVSIQLGKDRHAARLEADGKAPKRGVATRNTLGPYRVTSVGGDELPSLVGEATREREDKQTLSILARVDPSGAPDQETQRLLDAAQKLSGERIVAVFVSDSDQRSASLASTSRIARSK